MGFRNWNQWQFVAPLAQPRRARPLHTQPHARLFPRLPPNPRGNIDQQMMEDVMDAMVKPRDANGTSFASLGYSDVGLDDYWQKCGSYGPRNYTYHDALGNPQVDTDRFPDLGAMVAKAHALNLTAGFYSNNCRCADHCTDTLCFAADVNAILGWNFDSLKLDGCGKQENVQLWYDLFNWSITSSGNTRKPMVIENCHNGPRQGSPASITPFGPHDPTPDWCPFHMYRSSTDIRPVYASVLTNLLTIPPLAKANLSRPGCWA